MNLAQRMKEIEARFAEIRKASDTATVEELEKLEKEVDALNEERAMNAKKIEMMRNEFMAKKVLDQRIEISGRKEMNRLVNLLVQEGYEVLVYADSFQRETKTDKDRSYIVRYVHPDFNNCGFVAKELK